ncbi:MAG: DUF4922 domain-containing protein [Ignavibacteria bacterium]
MNNSNRLILTESIQALLANHNYADAAGLLLEQQRAVWRELNENYDNLKFVKTRTIPFNKFSIELQFNPGRIKSTSAEVDENSVLNRKCFLCDKNLPPPQKGFKIFKDYILFCNPHPVFPEHFTIVSAEHKPQEILSTFLDFVEIVERLGKRYSLIYNGPKCGASAPDHLHFQAGTKQFMPIENDLNSIIQFYGKTIFSDNHIKISSVDDSLRKFFILETNDINILYKTVEKIYKECESVFNLKEEPLMNVVSVFDEDIGWKVLVFLRAKHRPTHYFLDEENRILFSPAAIDIGGVCITPIKKDFEIIDKKLLEEIFVEIFPTKKAFDQLVTVLRLTLN